MSHSNFLYTNFFTRHFRIVHCISLIESLKKKSVMKGFHSFNAISERIWPHYVFSIHSNSFFLDSFRLNMSRLDWTTTFGFDCIVLFPHLLQSSTLSPSWLPSAFLKEEEMLESISSNCHISSFIYCQLINRCGYNFANKLDN